MNGAPPVPRTAPQAAAPATAQPRPWQRHQLPALSPITLSGLVRGAVAELRAGDAALEHLRAELAARYGPAHVTLCDSGTAALTLALRVALRQRSADTVAAPAYTCFDVATALVGAGTKCTFYDIDPDTLGPDPDSFARALREAAVAIVAPSYGVPVDWDALQRVAADTGSLLVEDAAQGHGAAWDGRRLGALGPCSILSFGRGKGWTGGGGGALLLRDPDLIRLAEELEPDSARPGAGAANLARVVAQWLLGRPTLFGIPSALPGLGLGETRYHPPRPVTGMTAGAAAIAATSMARADAEAETRRRNGAAWTAALSELEAVRCIRVPVRATPGYIRYPIRLVAGRHALHDMAVARALGVGPPYPTPLPELTETTSALVRGRATDHPGAREIVRTLVTLPVHSGVTERDRGGLLSLLRSART